MAIREKRLITLRSLSDLNLSDPIGHGDTIVWDEISGKWINQPRATFVPWVQGNTYYPQQTVFNDGYLSVANKVTTDHPTPQTIGLPVDVYQGTSPTTPILAKQIVSGQRYGVANAVQINALRVNVQTGNHYTVFIIIDPLGIPLITPIADFEAISTGWAAVNLRRQIIPSGTVFDILQVASEPDPTPTTFNGNWDYNTPQNPASPNAGEIVQARSEASFMDVHYFDNDGGDRTVELQALAVGDIVDAVGIRWAIIGINQLVTSVIFTVTPATVGSPTGVSNFIFETVVATPITIMEDIDYWLTSPFVGLVKGLIGIDNPILTVDDTAYGIDVNITDVDQSPDWDLFGVP